MVKSFGADSLQNIRAFGGNKIVIPQNTFNESRDGGLSNRDQGIRRLDCFLVVVNAGRFGVGKHLD
jgi:hypothetical protein